MSTCGPGRPNRRPALAKELLADAAHGSCPRKAPSLPGSWHRSALLLLQAKAFTEAEPLLRECLAIREKTQPDEWTTFTTKSMLGGALLGQKKYAEAEPLLLAGYEGMKQREAKIPPPGKVRLTEALERLVQLYEALEKKDEAAKWRKELEARKESQERLKSKKPSPEKSPAFKESDRGMSWRGGRQCPSRRGLCLEASDLPRFPLSWIMLESRHREGCFGYANRAAKWLGPAGSV